jgi:hypothetical protein
MHVGDDAMVDSGEDRAWKQGDISTGGRLSRG